MDAEQTSVCLGVGVVYECSSLIGYPYCMPRTVMMKEPPRTMLARRNAVCRAAAIASAIAVVLTAVVGCSADVGENKVMETSTSNAFPVTVEHAHGEVTIETAPSRVVALGSGDAQIASALGMEIVGAVRNPSSPDGNWSGMILPSEVLTLDSTTPNIEAIAALDPDVILATTAQAEYDKAYEVLSRIAPVISYKTALLQDSGDELTELIGMALGRRGAAESLVVQARGAIADFRSSHPNLEGKSFAYGQYAGGTLYLLGQESNPSARFLSSLGMRGSSAVSAAATESTAAFVKFSPEGFGILDTADVAMISTYGEGSTEEFLSLPTVTGLVSTGEHRLIVIDQELSSALLFPNPATTEFLLDRMSGVLAIEDRAGG
ncbi:ABC transporter substrate-binding protein [Rhodococcus sp. IEGM 1241]|uniref:ABC transporter substrate-binding protein n=2 Tax=Rhodococcus TaxID=1827 RepID=UPI0029547025|nr:ABC transporter substrate-binding protein [Rhodococcus sp. IEGM 1241]MDV8015477.1 ABC transporter substrate-binding protein [Rhodococcus sp. IEGM 1241]